MVEPRLHAPTGDGEVLIRPEWNCLPSVVEENRILRSGYEYDCQGRSLLRLSGDARVSVLRAAVAYTKRYRDVATEIRRAAEAYDSNSTPVLLAGHQPTLFHPGVWIKNFALSNLAATVGGIGVNLLIDSDAIRGVSTRVPVGDAKHAAVEAVAFDQPSARVPYEERAILDPALFDSFGQRAAEAIRPIVAEPLLKTFWPIAREMRQSTPNLGACLAAARHRLEADWGASTLEAPASLVCKTTEFRWFVAHLLAHLPRFADAHNTALEKYRTAHRMRGAAHPAPNLMEEDGWLEAPFWVWSADDPVRRRVFARGRCDRIEITDRAGWRAELALAADGDAETAAEQLAAIEASGIRIRSRALITTLFARVFLGDLFLHGIGGAKYDTVTDDIARDFFGITPPRYAAVSATLRLPVDVPPLVDVNEPCLRHAIRQVKHHPERFLDLNNTSSGARQAEAQRLVAEKRRWVETPKTPDNAAERHRAIVGANACLQPYVEPASAFLHKRRAMFLQRSRSASILLSREYAFCLHSPERLSKLLLESFATIS